MSAREPRPACGRCGRPLVVCFCQHITRLPTRTRVLLLQHPRERRMGIGTARLAHLALPGSQLRVGVDFADDPVVRPLLEGAGPAFLLFPGPGARPVESLAGRGSAAAPLTLVVLDGTWAQASKLLKLNPALGRLPRVAFQPSRPSGYLIRKQPADFCVSTIEALAEVLDRIEPEAGPFDRLLDPFRAMVERQRRFEVEVHARRHFRARPDGPRRPGLAERLAADWARLVFVQGEANAWSRRDPARQEPETVHWVAHRPARAETFQAVVAPRRPLAPATAAHVELDPAALLAGLPAAEWHQAWRRFLQPEDLLVGWGTFYRDLAAADGLDLTRAFRDLRADASQLLRRRVGTVDECAAALESSAPALELPGRAGRRLSALVGVAQALRGRAFRG